tara:strand:- start:9248 stop:10066 length:819 start_codon:yes stop_codon:yes gene_type:complete
MTTDISCLSREVVELANRAITTEAETATGISAVVDVINEANGNNLDISGNWPEYYELTRQELTNMKSLYKIKSIRDALEARHASFYNKENYNIDCNNNAEYASSGVIEKEKNDFNKLKTYMKAFLESYYSLFNYKSSIGAIKNDKLDELAKLEKKIDTYNQNLYMDNRKDTYQNNNYEFYKNIHFYILIIYYSVLVLYFIFSNFFKDEKYKNIITIILILLYIILPFILKYIINYIHIGYNYCLEYFNLRDKIISYPYIISDEEIINNRNYE